MRLRETIAAGIFTIIAALLAELVPALLPSTLSSTDGVLFVRELQTQISPDMVIEQFRNSGYKTLNRRITVLKVENIGSDDLTNFKLEIRTNANAENIQAGSNVSGDFFSSDQSIAPLDDRSFQGVYRRFPPNSAQHIFLLSDSDFSFVSIVPNKSNIDVVWADQSLFEQAARLKWQNYITGAFWLLAILGLIWTALRLFKWRVTLQFRKVP